MRAGENRWAREESIFAVLLGKCLECAWERCAEHAVDTRTGVSEGRLNKTIGTICRLLTRTCRLVFGWGSKNRYLLGFLLPHTTGYVATTLTVHSRPITQTVCASSSWLINCPTVWFFIVKSPSHVSEGDSKHTTHLYGDVWTCVVRAKITIYSRAVTYD